MIHLPRPGATVALDGETCTVVDVWLTLSDQWWVEVESGDGERLTFPCVPSRRPLSLLE